MRTWAWLHTIPAHHQTPGGEDAGAPPMPQQMTINMTQTPKWFSRHTSRVPQDSTWSSVPLLAPCSPEVRRLASHKHNVRTVMGWAPKEQWGPQPDTLPNPRRVPGRSTRDTLPNLLPVRPIALPPEYSAKFPGPVRVPGKEPQTCDVRGRVCMQASEVAQKGGCGGQGPPPPLANQPAPPPLLIMDQKDWGPGASRKQSKRHSHVGAPRSAVEMTKHTIEDVHRMGHQGCAWCGVVWCGVVWCGVVWCGVVWCGVVWCGVVWCGVVWCGVVWCGVVWCGVVWCGVVCRRRCYQKAMAGMSTHGYR